MTIAGVPISMEQGAGGVLKHLIIGAPVDILAFPDAMGMGAHAQGAFHPDAVGPIQFLEVTNLNDSGPGSVDAAFNTDGPRVVTFTVSGYALRDDALTVDAKPYMTAVYATSPGGFCHVGAPLKLRSNEIVATQGRSRRGSNVLVDPGSNGESLYISDSHSIFLRNWSLSVGTDETLQAGSFDGPIYGLSIAHFLVADALTDAQPGKPNHGFGGLFSSKFRKATPPEASIYNNHWANNQGRNPKYTGDGLFEHLGNTHSNWENQNGSRLEMDYDNFAGSLGEPPRINIYHNWWEGGPEGIGHPDNMHGLFTSNGEEEGVLPLPLLAHQNQIYIADNGSNPAFTGVNPSWPIAKEFNTTNSISVLYQKSTPWDMAAVSRLGKNTPIVVPRITSTAQALLLLEKRGATTPIVDAADQRVKDNMRDFTGAFVADVTYPNETYWPTLPVCPPYPQNHPWKIAWEFEDLYGFAIGTMPQLTKITSFDVINRGVPAQWEGYEWYRHFADWLENNYVYSIPIKGMTLDIGASGANVFNIADNSDNWPSTWGALKSWLSWGDGSGVGGSGDDPPDRVSQGVATRTGDFDNQVVVNWNGGFDPEHVHSLEEGKSHGILSMPNGPAGAEIIWLWRSGTGSGADGFELEHLHKSTDDGATFPVTSAQWDLVDNPTQHISQSNFIQFGKQGADTPHHAKGYVYSMALLVKDALTWDVQFPGEIVLMRCPDDETSMSTKASWEFCNSVGAGPDFTPTWINDITQAVPVLTDAVNGFHRFGVVFVKELQRYVMHVQQTTRHTPNYEMGLLDAQFPWGPWNPVQRYDPSNFGTGGDLITGNKTVFMTGDPEHSSEGGPLDFVICGTFRSNDIYGSCRGEYIV